MRLLIPCVVAAVAPVLSAYAGAHTARWLTIEEAVAQAAASNPELLAAREALAKAGYDRAARRAAFWPALSGTAGWSRSDSDDRAGDASERTSAGLSADYTLFAGFADRVRVAQAEQAWKQAEAEWFEARADVGASVHSAFIELLHAQERAALAEAIAERRGRNLDLVALRHDAGSEHKGSLLRAQATARQAGFDVGQARRAIAVQQRALANSIGAGDREAWVARGEWQSAEPDATPEWRELARATPRWRGAEAALENRRLAVAAARSGLYPEVALRAGIDRSGESWPPDTEAWSVGASLSVPLFTGGRTVNEHAAAKAAHRQAQAEFLKVTQQIQLDLESSWAGLRDARERREVQAAFLEAAEVRAEIAREQYANGLLSFQNWDQIEDELIQRQQALLAGERDAALATAEWNRVRGVTPLPAP